MDVTINCKYKSILVFLAELSDGAETFLQTADQFYCKFLIHVLITKILLILERFRRICSMQTFRLFCVSKKAFSPTPDSNHCQ